MCYSVSNVPKLWLLVALVAPISPFLPRGHLTKTSKATEFIQNLRCRVVTPAEQIRRGAKESARGWPAPWGLDKRIQCTLSRPEITWGWACEKSWHLSGDVFSKDWEMKNNKTAVGFWNKKTCELKRPSFRKHGTRRKARLRTAINSSRTSPFPVTRVSPNGLELRPWCWHQKLQM